MAIRQVRCIHKNICSIAFAVAILTEDFRLMSRVTNMVIAERRKDESIDLEEAADKILASAGAIGKENGIYTNRQLSRKIRNEYSRLPEIDEGSVSSDFLEYISEKQLEEVIDVAALSAMQEICFRLHIAGLSLKEIAKSLDVHTATMASSLRLAKRKVKHACEQGKYAGWYEVYLSEIRRKGCRGRSH